MPLGLNPERILTRVATYGIPEMGPAFVREILEVTQPITFTDLVKVSGLTHGNGTWEGNAYHLLSTGICAFREVVSCSEDIRLTLISRGLGSEFASAVATFVHKGEEIPNTYIEKIKLTDLPNWYIASCNKIRYLFPKAHSVENAIAAIQSAYYKLYFPQEFYTANFIIRGKDFDFDNKDYDALLELVVQDRNDSALKSTKAYAKEKMMNELALEAKARYAVEF